MALYTPGIVVTDVAFNHPNQFLLTGKASAIIALPFQDSPEALHRAVVDAVSHTGHTLCHPGLLEFMVKCPAGILKPSVTMEQWMSVRIGFDSLVKGFVDKRIIIALADRVGHDATVTKIQNSAQIELVYRGTLVPLELSYIGKPLFVRLVRIKLAVQTVLRDVLRVPGLSGAAVAGVLDGGLNASCPADTQHAFIVHIDAIVVAQNVVEPSVTFIRAFLMKLFNLIGQTLVFLCSAAQFTRRPLVVGRTGHMEQSTGCLNGITLFFVALLDCLVN